MARPTDEYVVDRFFDYFADLPSADRAGLITGMRATHRSMMRVRVDAPAAEPQGALATADEAAEPPTDHDEALAQVEAQAERQEFETRMLLGLPVVDDPAGTLSMAALASSATHSE